eukprot:IDg14825t1
MRGKFPGCARRGCEFCARHAVFAQRCASYSPLDTARHAAPFPPPIFLITALVFIIRARIDRVRCARSRHHAFRALFWGDRNAFQRLQRAYMYFLIAADCRFSRALLRNARAWRADVLRNTLRCAALFHVFRRRTAMPHGIQ